MDIFGIKRRREARKAAERIANHQRMREQEAAIFAAGSNPPQQRGVTAREAYRTMRNSPTGGYEAPYSPMTDILSPLNPASPLSIYSTTSSSYDSGSSCSSSSDSGSSSSDSGSSSGGGCD